jgi:hypothetical protein
LCKKKVIETKEQIKFQSGKNLANTIQEIEKELKLISGVVSLRIHLVEPTCDVDKANFVDLHSFVLKIRVLSCSFRHPVYTCAVKSKRHFRLLHEYFLTWGQK